MPSSSIGRLSVLVEVARPLFRSGVVIVIGHTCHLKDRTKKSIIHRPRDSFGVSQGLARVVGRADLSEPIDLFCEWVDACELEDEEQRGGAPTAT